MDLAAIERQGADLGVERIQTRIRIQEVYEVLTQLTQGSVDDTETRTQIRVLRTLQAELRMQLQRIAA